MYERAQKSGVVEEDETDEDGKGTGGRRRGGRGGGGGGGGGERTIVIDPKVGEKTLVSSLDKETVQGLKGIGQKAPKIAAYRPTADEEPPWESCGALARAEVKKLKAAVPSLKG